MLFILGAVFIWLDYMFFYRIIGYLDGLPLQIGEELICPVDQRYFSNPAGDGFVFHPDRIAFRILYGKGSGMFERHAD